LTGRNEARLALSENTGMWPYHPELLATPVPRYTSFPTAAEFGPQIGAARFEAELARAAGDVSLYVHIPYCEKICWYCGCNTAAANRKQRLAVISTRCTARSSSSPSGFRPTRG
jgi:oxygen-independent coproporphyrinogen-3 oxidase